MADIEVSQVRPPAGRLCTGSTLLFTGGFGAPVDLTNVSILITFSGVPVTIFSAMADGSTCQVMGNTVTCTRDFLPASTLLEFLVRFQVDAPGSLTETALFTGTNAAGQIVSGMITSLRQVFRCPRRVPTPPLLVCEGFLPCCVCRRPFAPRSF